MSGLENIVRPFQLPNTGAQSRQYLSPNQQSSPPISLYFGRSGSGIAFNAQYSFMQTYYVDAANVEVIFEEFSFEPFSFTPFSF